MANDGDRSKDPRYDNYPIEGKNRADVEWIGTIRGAQSPLLYEEHTNQIYETEFDEDNEVILPKNPEPLDEQSLAEYLEQVGEEHGWDFLTEFAEEHLERDEE